MYYVAIQHKINLVPELGHIVHDMVTDWVSTGSTETIRENTRPQEKKEKKQEQNTNKKKEKEQTDVKRTEKKKKNKAKNCNMLEWKEEKRKKQQQTSNKKRRRKKKGTVSKLLVQLLLSLCQLIFGLVKKEFKLIIMLKA